MVVVDPEAQPELAIVVSRRKPVSGLRRWARRVTWRVSRIKALTVAIVGVIVAGLRAVLLILPLYGIGPVARAVRHGTEVASSGAADTNVPTLTAIVLLSVAAVLPLVVLLLVLVFSQGRSR